MPAIFCCQTLMRALMSEMLICEASLLDASRVCLAGVLGFSLFEISVTGTACSELVSDDPE